jgi:CBS domain-containing protein
MVTLAMDIAFTEDIYEINYRSPLSVALTLFTGHKGLYRLTVVDDKRSVEGHFSVLGFLSYVAGKKGEVFKLRKKTTLEGLLNEPVMLFVEETIHKLPHDITLEEVISYMMENKVGHIILVDNNNVLRGVFTEGPIIRRLPSKKYGISVSEIMSDDLIDLETGGSIRDAIDLMSGNRIRRLPVLDKEQPQAIVTPLDILTHISKEKYFAKALDQKKNLDDFMNDDISTMDCCWTKLPSFLNPEDDIQKLIERIKLAETCGCLVMSKLNKIMGIVTERDLATKLPKIIGVKEFSKLIEG